MRVCEGVHASVSVTIGVSEYLHRSVCVIEIVYESVCVCVCVCVRECEGVHVYMCVCAWCVHVFVCVGM